MLSILFESALRATLIAAAVALVLRIFRIESAVVRHAVWMAVLLAMLMLPILVVWGPKAPVRILPPAVSEMGSPGAPEPQVHAVPAPADAIGGGRQQRSARWLTYAAVVYVAGLCCFVARLVVGSLQVKRLVRTAVLDRGRLTHSLCVTPITVGSLKPRVILPTGWSQYPARHLDAILLHEGEHVRRRDPLVQWVALLNRAVFWFHPLAWWLERHLSALAEEACDTAVLARGHDPHGYSKCLLDLARSAARAGGPLPAIGMAMPGARLPKRIRKILSATQAQRLSRTRLVWATVLCAVVGGTLAASQLAPMQLERQTGPSLTRRSSATASQVLLNRRGFAIQLDGHLRAHGAITERDRTEARQRAGTTDYAWLRDGDHLYIVSIHDVVKRAFDLYEQADKCFPIIGATAGATDRDPAPTKCMVSEAEIRAAQHEPGLVPGLSPAKKALMRRVWTLLSETAARGTAAPVR